MKASVPELPDQSESDSEIVSMRATLEAEGRLEPSSTARFGKGNTFGMGAPARKAWNAPESMTTLTDLSFSSIELTKSLAF